MNNIHNEHIYYIQQAIKKFELGNIHFHDFKSRMVGCTVGLENHINCDYDLDRLIDVWFESIEFCYLEKDWQAYGLEAGYFILEASKAFPNKVFLPENSDVVKDQLTRFFEKQAIPQWNQLFHPSNLLIDYLKQTGIMEPLITDYFRYLCLLELI